MRMRIAQALLLSLVTLTFVTCTSDTDDSDRRPRSYPGGADGPRSGGFARTTSGAGDGLEMMPPGDWWRDPQISVAVTLTPDQLASLDQINHDQSEEIGKLERDSVVAARDLRTVVDSSQPSAEDITGAGKRLRGVRDSLFDHRLQMFAAERALLTQTQWNALQQALASRNRPSQNDRGVNRGRGGRGGMGGRGRFPG